MGGTSAVSLGDGGTLGVESEGHEVVSMATSSGLVVVVL